MLPIVIASYGKKDLSLTSDKFNYMLCSTKNKYPTTLCFTWKQEHMSVCTAGIFSYEFAFLQVNVFFCKQSE